MTILNKLKLDRSSSIKLSKSVFSKKYFLLLYNKTVYRGAHVSISQKTGCFYHGFNFVLGKKTTTLPSRPLPLPGRLPLACLYLLRRSDWLVSRHASDVTTSPNPHDVAESGPHERSKRSAQWCARWSGGRSPPEAAASDPIQRTSWGSAPGKPGKRPSGTAQMCVLRRIAVVLSCF